MVALRVLRRNAAPEPEIRTPAPPAPIPDPGGDKRRPDLRSLGRITAAIALAVFGGVVLWPALADTPAPPPPWGLWISADYPADRGQKIAVKFYARIDVESRGGCDGRAGLTIDVTNLIAPPTPRSRPATFAIAAANASLTEAAFRIGAKQSWRPAHVGRRGPVAMAYTSRLPWAANETAHWRLRIGGVTRSAGYKGCYVATPQLFPLAADYAEWTRASSAQGALAARGAGTFFLDPVSAARVNVSAQGKVPDRATLDAGAFVVRHTARLACRDVLKEPPGDPPNVRSLVDTRSNCASVQTFYAPNTTREVDRSFFVAALVFSLAGALLLDAIFEPRRRARARR